MKYIILIISLLSLTSCFSQIHPIYDLNRPFDDTGLYFKDLNSDLDKYVGTWVWEENSNRLTVVLQKSVMHNMFDRYQEDIIVGNYKYEENGVIIIDTMTNPAPLPNLSSDVFSIKLWSSNRSPNISELYGRILDPIRSYYASYNLECYYTPPGLSPIGSTTPGEPAKMRFAAISNGLLSTPWDQPLDTRPVTSRIPYDIIMLKQ